MDAAQDDTGASEENTVSFELLEELRQKDRECLDLALSNVALRVIPTDVLDFHQLEELYLDSNSLSTLPLDMFQQLPELRYLDLRYNLLEGLPDRIGHHKNMHTLLLSHNKITALPTSLGHVATLTSLQTRGNPLYFPPDDVMSIGVPSVLAFLLERAGPLAPLEVQPSEESEEEEEAEPPLDDDVIVIPGQVQEQDPRPLLELQVGAEPSNSADTEQIESKQALPIQPLPRIAGTRSKSAGAKPSSLAELRGHIH